MTYFTTDEVEEPEQIRDAKGKCVNFCVGADLSEREPDPEELKKEQEILEREREKAREKARKQAAKPPPGFLKKAFFWICGIETTLNQDDALDTSEPHYVDTSIDQKPFWGVICDINAVIAMALAGFCFAFFNKYN